MTRVSDEPQIVALGNQRERIHTAKAHVGSPLFSVIAELHAYREALTRCDVPADVLAQARDELAERLAVGWERAERTPRLDDQWIALLVRYEAVCDALDVPAARTRLTRAEVAAYQAA